MKPSLTVIGAGRAARVLARLWHASGVFAIEAILNRSPTSGQGARAFIGAGHVVARIADLAPVQFLMIGVTDSSIAGLATELAQTRVCEAAPVVFHLSGALASQELAPLRARGAAIASVHPVTSFSDPEALVTRFAGTPCALEGDVRAVSALDEALHKIGATTFHIAPADKLVYHAGAVFAANYVVAVLSAACDAYRIAGIDGPAALALVKPLVDETLANLFARGPRAALTGPIARADMGLVRDQYQALAARDPELARIYRELGRLTARLALQDSPWRDEESAGGPVSDG
jgi:predicted short-subunit dehydrogenase-like oxidoreductase (DUF2520 family)